MALRKPSEYFKQDKKVSTVDENIQKMVKQPELNTFSDAFESFKNNLSKIEILSEFSETLNDYKSNLEKVNILSEKVEDINSEIQKLLKKEDLDHAMMAQLLVVEQSIQDVQNKVKGINEKNLTEIKLDVSNLTESVNEFLEIEVPRYKKLIVDSELRTDHRFSKLEENVNLTLEGVGEFVENKYQELTESLEGINEKSLASILDDFKSLENSLQEIKEEDIPKYKSFIVETELRTEDKLNQYEDKLNTTLAFFDETLNQTVTEVLNKINSIEDNRSELISEVTERINEVQKLSKQVSNELKSNDVYKNELNEKVASLEVDILRNEKHLRTYNRDIQNIQEEFKDTILKLNIDEIEKQNYELGKKVKYLEEVFEKFNEREILIEEVIPESLVTEPPSTENSDPLTPLDKNFVTLEQLQQHYRLFINRIQQQLSTLGGGGETRLKYLDDVVGIATNAAAYDGKYLKYNHSSGNFVFDDVTLEIAEENIIYVAKDGNDSNSGSLTSPKLTIKSAAESATSNTVIRIAPGTYIENNPITLPDQVTIIGHSLRETTVIPLNDDEDLFYVGNGCYVAEMSFSGSLVGKSVISFDPINRSYINQSPYIQNCTNFIPNSIGLKVDGSDAIGPLKSIVLDSYTQYNQGGIGVSITNEGYAQLVSLFTICNDTAIYCGSGGACDLTNSNSSFGNYGLVADGVSGKKFAGIVTVAASPLSDVFVLDFTTPTLNVTNAIYNNTTGFVEITVNQPHNLNVGAAVTIAGLGFTCPYEPGTLYYPSGEKGYIFNIDEITSSTSFIVNVGIASQPHYYSTGGTVKLNIVRPYDGQALYFNDLYYTVKRLNIVNGGSGYNQIPTITIDAPTTSWGIRAQVFPIIENGALVGADMISNGRGYDINNPPSVTISAPQVGINTAVATVELSPEYYTVKKSTEITNNISVVTLNENVPFEVGIGTTVNFFKQSRILATGYSFEYVGSGTSITSCLPFSGGVPIEENETDSRNGGLVVYTSTNHSGNFKIGDGVTINQNVGSITGNAYTKSLLSTMTPYILSLGGF